MENDVYNLYKVLEIEKTATDTEIKKAYRRQAKIYHPDKNIEKNSTKEFQRIQQAYQVLSDPRRRELYDHIQDLKPQYAPNHNENKNTLWWLDLFLFRPRKERSFAMNSANGLIQTSAGLIIGATLITSGMIVGMTMLGSAVVLVGIFEPIFGSVPAFFIGIPFYFRYFHNGFMFAKELGWYGYMYITNGIRSCIEYARYLSSSQNHITADIMNETFVIL